MDPIFLVYGGIIAAFVAIAVTLIGYTLYCGLLHEIVVSTGKPAVANITIAYKFERGPYQDCGALFTEACSLAPKLRCLGVYYDDPSKVPAAKLRYAVGSILAEGSEEPDPDLVETYTAHQYKVFSFPATQSAVYTTFPFKGALSVIIAARRVYSAMSSYAWENGLNAYPFFEIYNDGYIYFMAILDKDDTGECPQKFLVPEAIAAAIEDKLENEKKVLDEMKVRSEKLEPDYRSAGDTH